MQQKILIIRVIQSTVVRGKMEKICNLKVYTFMSTTFFCSFTCLTLSRIREHFLWSEQNPKSILMVATDTRLSLKSEIMSFEDPAVES